MAGILLLILTPVAFVRNLSKFSFTFLLGNLCILSTVIVVSYMMIKERIDYVEGKSKPIGKGVVAFNEEDYLSMIGFSCYAYEGIGVVMPIMQATAVPEKFG